MRLLLFVAALFLAAGLDRPAAAQQLPFSYKVETYREKDSDVIVFALRLEQPFLAEEFEKSNYLRLKPLDRNSYLVYPRETKFRKKHAEFFGRLRGTGKAKLRLSYEIVSENLDGSRKVDVRQTEVVVAIPEKSAGPKGISQQWARRQNEHFAELLQYYPNETFFQYVLLQSRDRYGVVPPSLGDRPRTRSQTETELYHLFSGSAAVQQALQRQALRTGPVVGDLVIPISELSPPDLQSLDYAALLKKKREAGVQPKLHEIAKLVPADQYFLHFNSMTAANELMDLSVEWGESLLRMLTVSARDHHLREKYEDQLCIKRGPLTRLFADRVISELAVTGSDFFIAEGTDLTLIFRLKKPDVFLKSAERWAADVKKKYPDMVEREFHYRGHKVRARYTNDRMVSSFVVVKGDYAIYSNSHVAIRKVVNTMIGAAPNLHAAADYRYVTTILPPSDDPQSGYL